MSVSSPALRWRVDMCQQTVNPLWVFSDNHGRIRLVDQNGDTEDLTPSQYHYSVMHDTREQALHSLMDILRTTYNAAARELGEPEIGQRQIRQGGTA